MADTQQSKINFNYFIIFSGTIYRLCYPTYMAYAILDITVNQSNQDTGAEDKNHRIGKKFKNHLYLKKGVTCQKKLKTQ